jgi:hypothetical protein
MPIFLSIFLSIFLVYLFSFPLTVICFSFIYKYLFCLFYFRTISKVSKQIVSQSSLHRKEGSKAQSQQSTLSKPGSVNSIQQPTVSRPGSVKVFDTEDSHHFPSNQYLSAIAKQFQMGQIKIKASHSHSQEANQNQETATTDLSSALGTSLVIKKSSLPASSTKANKPDLVVASPFGISKQQSSIQLKVDKTPHSVAPTVENPTGYRLLSGTNQFQDTIIVGLPNSTLCQQYNSNFPPLQQGPGHSAWQPIRPKLSVSSSFSSSNTSSLQYNFSSLPGPPLQQVSPATGPAVRPKLSYQYTSGRSHLVQSSTATGLSPKKRNVWSKKSLKETPSNSNPGLVLENTSTDTYVSKDTYVPTDTYVHTSQFPKFQLCYNSSCSFVHQTPAAQSTTNSSNCFEETLIPPQSQQFEGLVVENISTDTYVSTDTYDHTSQLEVEAFPDFPTFTSSGENASEERDPLEIVSEFKEEPVEDEEVELNNDFPPHLDDIEIKENPIKEELNNADDFLGQISTMIEEIAEEQSQEALSRQTQCDVCKQEFESETECSNHYNAVHLVW